MAMQSYTQNVRTVEAFQTPWNMTITVNGKSISGMAGQWLVVPPNGEEPYFLGDIEFSQQFTAVP